MVDQNNEVVVALFEELQVDWHNYKEKWGVGPNVLYINARDYAELFRWSALGSNVITFNAQEHRLFNAVIYNIVDFSQKFVWLELRDVDEALRENKTSVQKFLPMDCEIDTDAIDGFRESEFENITIPPQVLQLA